jgi:hypothetical protein
VVYHSTTDTLDRLITIVDRIEFQRCFEWGTLVAATGIGTCTCTCTILFLPDATRSYSQINEGQLVTPLHNPSKADPTLSGGSPPQSIVSSLNMLSLSSSS